MRLVTSGNELKNNAAEGWGSYSSPTGLPAGTLPINGTGGNDASGYFSSAINQSLGRQTPQKNGGLGYFQFAQNAGMARKLVDPANPEGPAITRTELYGHFAIHGNNNTGGERSIMHFMDANANIIASISMLDAGQPNTTIRLWKGDLYGTGTLLVQGTASNYFDKNTWTSVEWHLKMSAAGGIFEMRVNGGPIQSFSGDVRGSLGQVDIAAVWFVQRTTNNGTANSVDDIVINDTTGSTNNSFPGQVYVMMFQPGRDGTVVSPQLTSERGSQTQNWSSVRNAPVAAPGYGVSPDRMKGYQMPTSGVVAVAGPVLVSGTNNGTYDYVKTYVFPTADGQKDAYKLTGDVPLEIGSVGAVQLMSLVQGRDKTYSKFRHLLEATGPVEVLGPQRTIPRDAPDWISTLFEKNPNNTAWTLADFNALEFGAKFNV